GDLRTAQADRPHLGQCRQQEEVPVADIRHVDHPDACAGLRLRTDRATDSPDGSDGLRAVDRHLWSGAERSSDYDGCVGAHTPPSILRAVSLLGNLRTVEV